MSCCGLISFNTMTVVISSALKPIHEILEKAGISTASAALGLASIGVNDKIPAHITHASSAGTYMHSSPQTQQQQQHAPPQAAVSPAAGTLPAIAQLPLPPVGHGQLPHHVSTTATGGSGIGVGHHAGTSGPTVGGVGQFPNNIFDAASTLDVLKVTIQNLDGGHGPVVLN